MAGDGVRMRYLALEASKQRAREYGACLLGSMTKQGFKLAGVCGAFLVTNTDPKLPIAVKTKVFLPLDTIKICPWMAHKNNLPLLHNRAWGDYNTMETSKLLEALQTRSEYWLNKLMLDPTTILAGEVEGVSIVEEK